MPKPCQQCGREIANKFLETYCIACIEAAMETVTIDDIATVANELEAKIERAKPADHECVGEPPF
jgi:hypothetical protein